MNRVAKLFCRHDTVKVRRAHREACLNDHGKEAWVDTLKVYNFMVCAKCNKLLKFKKTERLFGEADA